MDTNLMTKAVWGTAAPEDAVKRVLIVEDNAEASEMLATACRLEGYEPVTAGEGGEALGPLEAGVHPRVILLDLHMPVMDGWQFRQLQRQHQQWGAIPVVIIPTAPEASRTADLAPLAQFGKPINLDALFELLR